MLSPILNTSLDPGRDNFASLRTFCSLPFVFVGSSTNDEVPHPPSKVHRAPINVQLDLARDILMSPNICAFEIVRYMMTPRVLEGTPLVHAFHRQASYVRHIENCCVFLFSNFQAVFFNRVRPSLGLFVIAEINQAKPKTCRAFLESTFTLSHPHVIGRKSMNTASTTLSLYAAAPGDPSVCRNPTINVC